MLFLFNILFNLWSGGKQVSINFRNFEPTFLETLLEKGGLNHVIFLFLFFLPFPWFVVGGSNFYWCLYPLSWRAFWYTGEACLNIFSFEEIDESLLLIASGIFFNILGGWLLWQWTYKGVSFGLINWAKVSELRSRVTSRKFKIFKLASIVIFKLCVLNILKISFLQFSTWRGRSELTANPSSLYSRMFSFRCWSWDRINNPTSSQISAP